MLDFPPLTQKNNSQYQEWSSGESLTCFWLYQTSLAIITLILKVNKIQWQHITFWANDPLSPDIAGPLMIRGVLAHQIWPGHQSAFTFITKQLPYLHFPVVHVQLHFSTHALLLVLILFCDKDFADYKLQLGLRVEKISNKKQSEGTFESHSQRT